MKPALNLKYRARKYDPVTGFDLQTLYSRYPACLSRLVFQEYTAWSVVWALM